MNRVIKIQVLFYVRNKDFTKSIAEHYTTVDRLMSGDDSFDYITGAEIIAKRQFTGLTDKNGVDIYEGDIIAFLSEYENEPNRQVLFDVDFLTYTILSRQEKEWVDGGSNHYKYCYQEGNEELYFLNDLDSYQVKVIGNIYSNPELLK